MKTWKATAAALFCVVALSACGGGGSTTGSTPAPVAASKSYTLALQGNPVPASSIQFDLTLPAGATVSVNGADGSVAAGSLALSGGAPAGAYLQAKDTAGTIAVAVISTQGIPAGPFATLTCSIPTGSTPPAGSSFAVSNLAVTDPSATPINGVTVTVN